MGAEWSQTAFEYISAVKSQWKKARQLVEAGLLRADPGGSGVWWVGSLRPVEPRVLEYRVQTNYDPRTQLLTWITCTCPHGLAKGGGRATCYHSVAVLLTLASQHEQGPPPTDSEAPRASLPEFLEWFRDDYPQSRPKSL